MESFNKGTALKSATSIFFSDFIEEIVLRGLSTLKDLNAVRFTLELESVVFRINGK